MVFICLGGKKNSGSFTLCFWGQVGGEQNHSCPCDFSTKISGLTEEERLWAATELSKGGMPNMLVYTKGLSTA